MTKEPAINQGLANSSNERDLHRSDDLDCYRRHSRITDPGLNKQLFSGLPVDVAALAKVIGGVMVHRDWTWRFGFTLPEQRRDEANTRHVEAILDRLGTLDERRAEHRFAG